MKVVSAPLRLRFVTWLIFLSIPLVGLEVIMVQGGPWWEAVGAGEGIRLWGAAFGLIAISLGWWISHGKGWAVNLTVVLAVLWCLGSAYVAVRIKSYGLGLFSLGLVFYWLFVCTQLIKEFHRPYFNSGIRWYQGLPIPISRLTCELSALSKRPKEASESDGLSLRVCRLDRDGAFVFTDEVGGDIVASWVKRNLRKRWLRKVQLFNLGFRHRDDGVQCVGYPVGFLDSGKGIGFRFKGMTEDQRKRLGDFVERLKGEGYGA